MKKTKTFVCQICLLLIGQFFCSFAWSIDFGQRNTQQWDYQEYSIKYPSYNGNPFDVVAKVTLVHSSGSESRTTEMFYVGNQEWRFRLTPTKTGVYTFETNSSIEALNGHKGKLRVSENTNPNKRGFLSARENRWIWEANQQVVIPQYMMWGGNAVSASRIGEFADTAIVNAMIDEFVLGHGFTGFHTGPIARGWFNSNQAGQALVAGEVNPDPDTFAALENLISTVYAAGGHVHLWVWGDQRRGQTPLNLSQSDGGGLNGIVDRRLQRYIASRLGPIPGWSMGYGFDVDEWDSSSRNGHGWREYIKSHSGWFHFLGSRPLGPNNGLATSHTRFSRWNSGFDYSSFEHHLGGHTSDEVYDVFVSALEANSDQPVFSEDRTRLGKRRTKDVNIEQTRDFLWASAMAGGIAGIWGDRRKGHSIPSRPYRNKEQLQTYSIFFRDKNRIVFDSIRANYLSANADTKVLHSPSKGNFLLYRQNAKSIQIDLSGAANALSAVAVDTKKAYVEVRLGILDNSNQTIKLPTTSNWAIAIEASVKNDAVINSDSTVNTNEQ